jgi:MYXO-CTERM domain-containing protein
MRYVLALSFLTVAASGASAGIANEPFDVSPTLGAAQAPGVWYTDRYAPAGFQSAFFDGDNRLQHQIAAADGANSRPGSFSGAFYNTQGRKYDLPSGSTFLAIDLYVPADWASTERRMAGVWGTAFNALDAVSAYPILEFTSDSASPRFRGYNTNDGSWIDLGLPSGFSYDAWYTLQIEFTGGQFIYSVGDVSGSVVDLNSSVSIGNTILQGHNTTDGVSYDIYWDNLTTVPAPGAFALLALGGLALSRRRR